MNPDAALTPTSATTARMIDSRKGDRAFLAALPLDVLRGLRPLTPAGAVTRPTWTRSCWSGSSSG